MNKKDLNELCELLTNKKWEVDYWFHTWKNKYIIELFVFSKKDFNNVIKFLENNKNYSFYYAKLYINYENYKKSSIEFATENLAPHIKVISKSQIFNIFNKKKEKWEIKKLYIYLIKNNIEFKKSPVIYSFKEKFISECESQECKEKYWPQWCWYNRLASLKMQIDKKYNYFWFHDKKVKKEVFIKETKIHWKQYISISWKYYSKDVLKNATQLWIKLPKTKYIEDNLWNTYLVYLTSIYKTKIRPFLNKCWYKIIESN